MKILRIDEKWSIVYNPDDNDRPVGIRRYGEPHSLWDQNNFATAMFYALLEKSQ